MANILKVPDKGDPSDILQIFPNFNLQLLCCRYWWLRKWEFQELSFPYWRIYHNNKEGAVITYNGNEYALTPDRIMIIAPNTSYATRLFDHKIPNEGFCLEGGRVGGNAMEENSFEQECILHLFIHFNVGMPYDHIEPGIFIFELDNHLKQKFSIIKNQISSNYERFNYFSILVIQSLISDLLSEIPVLSWNSISKDSRILDLLSFIEKNLHNDLANKQLAANTKLSTNAFTRLFTAEMWIPPQRYVKQKRVDKACMLLHHSQISIDEVASQTGFANRYHFSRVFKSITGIAPAQYKKELSFNGN